MRVEERLDEKARCDHLAYSLSSVVCLSVIEYISNYTHDKCKSVQIDVGNRYNTMGLSSYSHVVFRCDDVKVALDICSIELQ